MWEREVQPEHAPAPSPALEASPEQAHPLLRMQQLAGNRATTEQLTRSGLRVSKPEDTTERAADDRAGTAVAGTGDGGFDPGPDFAAGLTKSAQTPLSPQLRAELSQRVGADLSSLTLHTDDTAARLADSVDASAFTLRNHVYLGTGARDLSSPESKNVLAHEAAHVAAHSVGASDGNSVHRAKLPEWMRKLSRAMPRFGRKKEARPSYPPLHIDAPAYAPTRPSAQIRKLQPLQDAVTSESVFGNRNIRNNEFEEGNTRWASVGGHQVTHAATEEDTKRYAVNVDEETGAFMQNGQVLDTQNAMRTFSTKVAEGAKDTRRNLGERGGYYDAEHERAEGAHMFIMTPSGQFKTADQLAEEKRYEGERVHHSTFETGNEVAAAGEMMVRQGRVAAISDRSGHYRPNVVQTHQAVDRLAEMGTPLEQLHVELGSKMYTGDRTIDMTGLEMHGWSDEMDRAKAEAQKLSDEGEKSLAKEALRAPEDKIRAAHAKKSDMLSELLGGTPNLKHVTPNMIHPAARVQLAATRRSAKRNAEAPRGWQLPSADAGPLARPTPLGEQKINKAVTANPETSANEQAPAAVTPAHADNKPGDEQKEYKFSGQEVLSGHEVEEPADIPKDSLSPYKISQHPINQPAANTPADDHNPYKITQHPINQPAGNTPADDHNPNKITQHPINQPAANTLADDDNPYKITPHELGRPNNAAEQKSRERAQRRKGIDVKELEEEQRRMHWQRRKGLEDIV